MDHTSRMTALLGAFRRERNGAVADAMRHGVAGVVVGSAYVRIINENLDDDETLHRKLSEFTQSMKAAAKGTLLAE